MKKRERVEFYFHSDSLGCAAGLVDDFEERGYEATLDGEDRFGQWYVTLSVPPVPDEEFDRWFDAILDIVFDNGCDSGCSLARMEETCRRVEDRVRRLSRHERVRR